MNKMLRWLAVICLAILSATLVQAQTEHPFLWTQAFGMRDLGALTKTGDAVANGISNTGLVVGSSDVTKISYHAFLWTPGQGIRDLGTLGFDYLDSSALDVNDAGQVVGWNYNFFENRFTAFIWSAQEGMKGLGTLGGNSSQAWGINDAGQVVGWSTDEKGELRAFLWTIETGMIDLGTLGGDAASAYNIDNAGHVVGFSTLKNGTKPHGFIWTAATGMQDIGASKFGCFPADVNATGAVVGYCGTLDGHEPSFWNPGEKRKKLPTFGRGGEANGINASDQIVGFLNIPFGSRAVLWEGGVAINLGTLGGNVSSASDINDLGQVVGFSFLDSDHGHFISDPTIPLDMQQ